MEFKLQMIIYDDKSAPQVIDLLKILKPLTGIETLGLNLDDSKAVLKSIQAKIITTQLNDYLSIHQCCPDCHVSYRLKDRKNKQLNTLFGQFNISSPRFYACHCHKTTSKSFTPLSKLITDKNTPELLYMESKYASLMSYGLTTKLLQDFLPIHQQINAMTIRNQTLKIAEKLDKKLGQEQYFFIEGCPYQWNQLPKPDEKITMGIDGGYLRQWENKKKNFEVIAGKSISKNSAKFFGLVQSVDQKPKRCVYEVLKSQGMQNNQTVEFLSDGADNVRDLQRYLNPKAKHILDWFHVSMRFTVLKNYAKGYQKYDTVAGAELIEEFESAKWHLWHGHTRSGYEKLEWATWMIDPDSKYPQRKKFENILDEMCTYISRNSPMMINYGERWRHGDRISTGFVESTVNCFVTKRFSKKQQMQWTPIGAHSLMQVRAKVMNHELSCEFKNWYPEFNDYDTVAASNQRMNNQKLAA